VSVVVVLAAALVSGICWSLASPIGASPDDDYHQASIWCPVPLSAGECGVERAADGSLKSIEVPKSVAQSAACFAFHPEVSGSCTTHISDTQTIRTDRFNKGEYPGAYYRVMHVFVGPWVERSVAMMRIFNVVLAVLLLGGLALIANTGQRRLLGMALLAPMIPLGIFLTASVNPSGWAFVGLAVAALGLLIAADAQTRTRHLVATGIAIVGAAQAVSARGDAGPYLCVTTAAVAIATVRWEKGWLLTRLPGFVVIGLIGLVTFVTNSQAGLIGSTPNKVIDKPTHLFYYNLTELPNILIGMFGGWALGWLDNPMPAVVSSSSLFAAIFVIVTGIQRFPLRKALSAGLIAIVLVALPLKLLQQLGEKVGFWVQPRYLLPLAPVLLALLAYDHVHRGAVRITRSQAVIAAVFISLANALGLYTTLRRYLTGLDGPVILGRDIEWWWPGVPGPRVIFVMGAICFAVVAFAVLLAGSSWRPTSAVDAPSAGLDDAGPSQRRLWKRTKAGQSTTAKDSAALTPPSSVPPTDRSDPPGPHAPESEQPVRT
jgi:hypothetical protein